MAKQINYTNFKARNRNSLEASSSLLKIYKSSAGSGKTYQLVLNYLTLILKSTNPDKFKRILAITFTNKAAQEMKERVLGGLRKLIEGTDSSFVQDYVKSTGIPAHELQIKAQELLSNILHNYGQLHILTIDKFVHRIIRSFSKELGLTTNFELTFDFDAIAARCVEEVLQELGNDEQLTKILIDYYQQLIDQEDQPNIEKALADRSKILSKEDSIEKLSFYADKDLSFFVNVRKDIRKNISELTQEALKLKTTIISILGNELNHLKNGTTKAFGSILIGWENLGIPEAFTESQLTKVSNEEWISKSKSKDHPELVAILESNSEILKVHFLRINEIILRISFLDSLDKNIMSFALLNDVQQQLDQYKKDNNVVLISELNRIISEIISKESAPYIYEKIGTRFENYFIDEFQDTSELQWQNMVPLIHDSLANGNENLIVGDAKQSIYRWRGGNAQQFIDLPTINFDIADKDIINRSFDHHKFIDQLSDNYRSSKTVIEFNNWFFNQLSGITDSSLITKMYADVSQNLKRTANGYVEVVIKKAKSDYNKDVPYDLDLLRQIEESKQDGYALKDICVLVRTNKGGSEIANFLTQKNIPVTSQDSLLLWESHAIKLLYSFIKVLHHETQENILRAFSNFGKKSLINLFESYRIPADQNSFYNSGYDFKKFLQNELPQFDPKFFSELSIYDQVDYLIKILNLQIEDLYIDKFLNLTFEFQKRYGHQTNRFIEHLEEKMFKSSVTPPESTNAITVMTIHKSKGLQFPVVIIPKQIDSTDKDSIWISGSSLNDLGLPYVHMRPIKNAPDDQINAIQKDHSEQNTVDILNMIYVAQTRAEDRLYVHFVEYNSSELTKKQIKLIESHAAFDRENSKLLIGARETYLKKAEHTSAESLVISSNGTSDWRNRLILAKPESTQKFENEDFNEKNWGVALHKILQDISEISKWEQALNRFIRKNKEWNSLKIQLEAVVKSFAINESILELYSGSISVISEREIGTAMGQTLRPDKVIIKSNEVIVIDFKTGEAHPKHRQQILAYGEILNKIYENPIKLVLIYLSNNQITVLHV